LVFGSAGNLWNPLDAPSEHSSFHQDTSAAVPRCWRRDLFIVRRDARPEWPIQLGYHKNARLGCGTRAFRWPEAQNMVCLDHRCKLCMLDEYSHPLMNFSYAVGTLIIQSQEPRSLDVFKENVSSSHKCIEITCWFLLRPSKNLHLS
jgi:hypothetical protein